MSNLTTEDIKLLGDLFSAKLETVNEKIKGVHIQMDTEFKLVHERLDGIEKRVEKVENRLEKVEVQTTKTNGRVTDLEKSDATHILTCPNVEKINKLNEDLSEYRIIKKYPKIALGIIVITCISLFMGGYIAWSKFKTEIKGNIKTEISSISDSTNK